MSDSSSKFKYANLSTDQLEKINSLEKDMNVCLVAFQEENKIAVLENEDINKLKELEKELGVTIVAYKKSA